MKTNIKSQKTKLLIVVALFLQSLVSAEAVLVGQWNFNENTGTTSADVSGNGNTAALQGTTGWGPGAVAGDYAATFDGTSATIDYGTVPAFNVGTQYSLAVWMKPDVQSGEQLIFGKGYNFGLTYFQGGLVYFYGASQGVSASVTTGEWSFVVGTFQDGVKRIYVNGAAVTLGYQAPETAPDTSAAPLTSGENLFGPNLFMGSLSQAQIYNSTLTALEVSDLYVAGPVVVPEPSVCVLLAVAGVAALGFSRKRKASAV